MTFKEKNEQAVGLQSRLWLLKHHFSRVDGAITALSFLECKKKSLLAETSNQILTGVIPGVVLTGGPLTGRAPTDQPTKGGV